MTIYLALILAAFVLTLIAAAGKVPLWVPVLLLCIALLIPLFPLK